MRRRVIRDLGTIVGIVVVLGAVIGVNIYVRLGSLQQQFDAIRRSAEANRKESGLELMDWSLFRKTKGTHRSGPTFPEDLKPKNGKSINLMGFMTPIDQFRDVEHFMLLPLPIQCYFCEMPPMRDVMLVKLTEGEKVDLVEEPVLLSGKLVLNEGPKQNFFYTLEDADMNLTKGEKYTPKKYKKQDRLEGGTLGPKLMEGQGGSQHIQQQVPDEQLLPPTEVPGSKPAAPPAPAPVERASTQPADTPPAPS